MLVDSETVSKGEGRYIMCQDLSHMKLEGMRYYSAKWFNAVLGWTQVQ